MNILIIADPILPVPPAKYGGIEREIDLMCRGLAKRGHGVHLLAGPGSRDYGGGLTIHRAPSAAYSSRAYRKTWFQFIVLRAALKADLIINHGRLDYLEAIFRTKKPVIHWFHNPLTGREIPYILRCRKQGDHFVGVSRSQVSGDPASTRFNVIYNAVDTERIPFSPAAASPPYVVFLGRLTPDKGVHRAIDAARRARIKLIIAGNIPDEAGVGAYFETAIKPHLGPECEYVGPYDESARIKLVGGAKALLFPIQWMEPFGLVMIEALASGTPVIASRMASTPEVVAHGRTGFLCDTVDEMAAAIHRTGEISRKECRTSIETRFSESAFISQLEKLIADVGAAPGKNGSVTRVNGAHPSASLVRGSPPSGELPAAVGSGSHRNGSGPHEDPSAGKKKRALKILMVSDPLLSVPPTSYGGTERGTDLMCRWLSDQGHRVHLIAGPGSKDYGGGLTVHRPPSAKYYSRAYRKTWFQFITLRPAATADVVINHGRMDYLETIYLLKKPVVHWFHNPISGHDPDYITRRQRQGDFFVALSRSHIAGHPEASNFSVIYNAVDTDAIPFSPVPAGPPYALFLGRLTRSKGAHLAIEAARRAGIKLVLAGNVPNEPGATEYFNREIQPFL
ncbi:MAG TPA: glycosyltransferase, partial [Opitutaceae bacterium]|nr:glycosyltransferase [Opitutaceae bacterium]